MAAGFQKVTQDVDGRVLQLNFNHKMGELNEQLRSTWSSCTPAQEVGGHFLNHYANQHKASGYSTLRTPT